MGSLKKQLVTIPVVAGLLAAVSSTGADSQTPHMPHGQKPQMHHGKPRPEPTARFRVTMEELHAHGGVPSGWTFSIPSGDAAEGRKVFATLECFACHEVKGEEFPADSKTPRGAGPELTGMGARHPAEYFAESILDPNRVIVLGPDYTGPDGLSKMPTYSDTMTLKQLVDVVAYLTSLTAGDMGHGHPQTGGPMKGDKK